MPRKPAVQINFRIQDRDDMRLSSVAERYPMTRYELQRRLFLLGLAHVEKGEDLFGAPTLDRLETLLMDLKNELKSGHDLARARDFNLAADSLENRTWLRTLGELLAPETAPQINESLGRILGRFLAAHEELSPLAPPLKS